MLLPSKQKYHGNPQIGSVKERVNYWKDRIEKLTVDLEETRQHYLELKSKYEILMGKWS